MEARVCVCVRVNYADMTLMQTLSHTHSHRCAVNKHNLADCFVKSQVASQRLNRPQIIRAAAPTRAQTKHCFLLHVFLFCLFWFTPGIMYKVGRVSKGQRKVVSCTKVCVTLRKQYSRLGNWHFLQEQQPLRTFLLKENTQNNPDKPKLPFLPLANYC